MYYKIFGFFVFCFFISIIFKPKKETHRSKNNNTSSYNKTIKLNNGADDHVIHGSESIRKQSFDRLTVNGALSADEIVAATIIINGSAYITDSICQTLIVNGTINCARVSVAEDTTIYGTGCFKNSQVKNVRIYSNRLDFADSEIYGNIVVAASNSGVQEIVLVDTVVHGDIAFEAGQGMVVLEAGSKIVGRVIGGTVV
jgi:cytoskeletal protein CcmA (bactofilin family)